LTNAAHKECYAQRQKVVRATGSITPVNIQSARRSGHVVTITTQGNHGMNVGQYVAISDVGDPTFNGVFMIATRPGNRSFTYANAGSNTTAASGDYTPKATLVQQIAVAEGAVEGTDYSNLYSNVVNRYVAYTCIVEPIDHDTTPATPKRWSGQFVITPIASPSAWSLGQTAGTFKVCRYTGDYFPDGVLSNNEHPLVYRGVRGALDNQNYVIVDGDVACPTDGPVDPFAQTPDYVNANTTQHQTQPGNSCSSPCGGLLSGGNGGGPSTNGGLPTGAEASSYASDFAFPMIKVGD
jgi:hypothetical protein